MEGSKKTKPLKRIEELRYLSHDHHHGLLLCWKIKTGFAKGISAERIKKYCDWFFTNYLKHHFEVEEAVVFSVLGNAHPKVKKALDEHQRLIKLFESQEDIEGNLKQIQDLLNKHIRFEERVLFPLIQEKATLEQLQKIRAADDEEIFVENNEDAFWLKK